MAALGVAAVANLANLAFSAWSWSRFDQWAARPRRYDADAAALYDSLVLVSAVVLSLAHLTILVLFIIWLYLAHRSDRMEPALLQHRSGWAIGAWFVPVLNLFRPLAMVDDVDRGAQSPGSRTSLVSGFWWAALIGACIADRVTAVLLSGGTDETPRQAFTALARANLSDVVASGLYVAAAVLGILLVARISRLVRDSPHAPVRSSALA